MIVRNSKIIVKMTSFLLGGILGTVGAQAQKNPGSYGYYDGPAPESSMPQSTKSRPSAFDRISYDLLEMGYRYMVFDDDNSLLDDGHAVSLDLSLDVLWYFFIEAEVLYGTTNTEVKADKFFDLDESGNYTEFELGIGGHIPLTDRFHLVASGGFFYENQDLSGDVFDDVDGIIDGGGIYLRPGVRMILTDSLEAGAFLEYTKLSDADDGNFGVSGSLIYKLTDAIGISGNIQLKDDVSTFGAGVRLAW
ncbi:MAG: hypothetical protein ACI9R3_002288 [Verrucomicrobiales bacterium]|jgi:hypothetical protein